MTVFDNIKKYSKLRGLNLQTVAEKAGLSKNVIYQYAKGTNPTLETLNKIANVLNVSSNDLLDGNEKSPEKQNVTDYYRIDLSKVDPSKRDEFVKDLKKYSKFLEDTLNSDDDGDEF